MGLMHVACVNIICWILYGEKGEKNMEEKVPPSSSLLQFQIYSHNNN